MTRPKQGEYLHHKNKLKETYYYSDEKEGVDVLSREIYLTKPLEIQYPFNRDGSPKYKFIGSIEFHNISPKIIDGVYKAANRGLGFTKNLSPIIYRLEESFPSINKIIVSPKKLSIIEASQITFNDADLSKIFHRIKPFKDAQTEALKVAANNALASVFTDKVPQKEEKYIKGNLGLYIKDRKILPSDLSIEDASELVKLIPDEIIEESLFYKTEEKINFIKLNSIRKNFEKIVAQKTDTNKLEERCQDFFKENKWIFSSILSAPVALYQDKAYVGGKTIENKEGKVADFLYRNSLTQNVYIIEIKTPLKKLIDSKAAYRKPNVFSLGRELTGGLVQILDQKDSLQKEFYSLGKGSKDEFNSFNPKALLVIGRLSDLTDKQIPTFELFRNNMKDVEIITYDELLARTNLILGQFVEEKPVNSKKQKS